MIFDDKEVVTLDLQKYFPFGIESMHLGYDYKLVSESEWRQILDHKIDSYVFARNMFEYL